MRVMCLQRVPALVSPLHWVVLPVPCGFDDTRFCGALAGLQILQGCKPDSAALEREIASETFFTIWQLAVWYFAPEGVL